MSPKKRTDAIRDSARLVAARLKPAAVRAKPLARNTGAAARRQLLRTRAWAAPQVERSGKVLQQKVVPKVSAALSSAAKKLDPAKPRHRRWQKPAGMATLTAAGGAAAAFLRSKMKNGGTAANGPATQSQPSDSMHSTPPNGQQKTSVKTEAE
jgi:hypothetical protein